MGTNILQVGHRLGFVKRQSSGEVTFDERDVSMVAIFWGKNERTNGMSWRVTGHKWRVFRFRNEHSTRADPRASLGPTSSRFLRPRPLEILPATLALTVSCLFFRAP